MTQGLALMQLAGNSPALARDLLEEHARQADRSRYSELLLDMVLRYAQAERELRELNELKNRFLGMAAHDLRNPLAALRGMADLLLELDMPKAQRDELLREVRKAADDMLRLVNDLLDVAVIESGRLDVRRRDVDFAQLVASRAALVKPLAASKGIALVLELPPDLGAAIDPDRCAQVVDNLLTNAIKFSPPGSRVTVIADAVPQAVRLRVRDSGPGVSPADRARLFGAFQKLAARPTAGEQSTGLGLAIVKKIVDAHGGSIDVANRREGGAEFTVSLPQGSPK